MQSTGGHHLKHLLLAPKPRTPRRTKPLLYLSSTFTTLPSHPESYTNLLTTLSKQCLLSRVHHLFDEQHQRTHHSQSCRILHARMLRLGLPLPGSLGAALVDLYSKSGDVGYSRNALGCLGAQAAAAVSSVLSGHARWGSPEDVVDAFGCVRRSNGGRPDQFGFAVVLSACSRLGVLDYGRQVHSDLVKSGFGSNAFCEASLVAMYAKCGRVVDARSVFDGISCPDTISWTNMIACYARVGMCEEALELFSRMEEMGGVPDQITRVTVISACVSLGRLEDARTLFKQIPMPRTIAWNAIISGYAQSRHEDDALVLYKEMRSRGLWPTRSTFGSVLSAAANMTALGKGQQVHSEAIRLGLDSNVFVGSSLINMYAKCSCVGDAKKVFDFSSEKNIVMWNAMLTGLVRSEQRVEVIEMFQQMRRTGLEADEFTFVSVLGACSCSDHLNLGRQVHSIIIRSRMDTSLFIANATLDMYSKCGEIDDAKAQFSFITNKDSISWNALIVGLAHNGEEEEAVRMLKKMAAEAIMPDEISFATVVSACSNIQAIETGKQIQSLSIKYNLNSNHTVGSSLIDLYSKQGDVEAASKVFAQVPVSSVVLRNALIAGLVQNNREDEAIELFRQMLKDGLKPSNFTFASILPACTGSFGAVIGKQVHCYTLKSGLLNDDTFLGVSLIRTYLKFKMPEDANRLFMDMPDNENLVEWTALISGHAQNGYSDEALLLFWRMRSYNVRSDEATYASVLKACSEVTALTDGKEVHGLIIKSGFGSHETAISALIDMYSKCGDVASSYEAFKELKNKKDIMSWNSMIVGFAKNGYAEEALLIFQKMQESQIEPDEITFLGVLIACTHAGLVSEGRHFFDSMSKVYRITPRVDHYACFIDLLGRGGHLQEAQEVLDRLPFEPDGVIWATYLAACRIHKDEERGKIAAEKLMELEPNSSSTYVLLSNLHATSGNWAEAKVAREAMRERGVRKLPGCSWITVGNKTSLFLAGDKFHPDAPGIYEILNDLTGTMKKDDSRECDILLSAEGLA